MSTVYQPSAAENEHDDLDPRIQMELERMNGATDDINKLEKELDEARGKFRKTLSEASRTLNMLLKKHKRSIEKSREYYQILAKSKKTQAETQRAAVQFRRASSFYKAAKETISLAELRLKEEGVQFDEAWQEMLNHSTIKMMDAEKEKMRSELEHHRKSLVYQDLEARVHKLEKSQRRNITTARPYYDLKTELELQLEQQKQNVEDLQQGVSAAKTKYRDAMSKLESISEAIHESRKLPLPPREPGVGCESDEDFPSEINLEKHLNFDQSGSDDGFSTDADSLYSYGSGSVSHLTHQDALSINSSDYDSAICSPQSRTLDRDFERSLTLVDQSSPVVPDLEPRVDVTMRGEVDGEASSAPSRLDVMSQQSTDTILYESETDSDNDDDLSCRSRSSTIKDQSGPS